MVRASSGHRIASPQDAGGGEVARKTRHGPDSRVLGCMGAHAPCVADVHRAAVSIVAVGVGMARDYGADDRVGDQHVHGDRVRADLVTMYLRATDGVIDI